MLKVIILLSICSIAAANEESTLTALNNQDVQAAAAYAPVVAQLQQNSLTQSQNYNTLASFLQEGVAKDTGSASKAEAGNGIIVFVSLGMPVLSLRQIITTANQLHIPVVVRGFLDNQPKESAKALYDVLHPQGLAPIQGGLEIDPVWFEGYGITQVPAVVVAPAGVSCTDKTPCSANQFDVVYGNIPIEEALSLIAKNGSVGSAVAAAALKEAK